MHSHALARAGKTCRAQNGRANGEAHVTRGLDRYKVPSDLYPQGTRYTVLRAMATHDDERLCCTEASPEGSGESKRSIGTPR